MKEWIQKNWVVVSGFLSAIAVSLQQFVGQPAVDYKVLGFAALMAVLSFAANQWRGKGVSATGIVGTLAAAFISVYQTGTFSWSQFGVSAILALLSAVAPPPKPATYETDKKIEDAKEVPPVDQA